MQLTTLWPSSKTPGANMLKFMRRHGCDSSDIRDFFIITAFISALCVWAAIGAGA